MVAYPLTRHVAGRVLARVLRFDDDVDDIDGIDMLLWVAAKRAL